MKTFFASLKKLHFIGDDPFNSTISSCLAARSDVYGDNDHVVRSYVPDEMAGAPYGMFVTKHIIGAANRSAYRLTHALASVRLEDVNVPCRGVEPHIIVFGKFVEEGDNTIDALYITSNLLYGLGVAETDMGGPLRLNEVGVPMSWHAALFGESHSSYDRSMVY